MQTLSFLYVRRRVRGLLYQESELEANDYHHCNQKQGAGINKLKETMDKETLARAKELEDDIRQMESALSYHKRGRWSHWGINDSASLFHFEFCKNWSHRDADMQGLPTWLNKPLMEVVERELERCKTELNNLGNEKPSAAECILENMKQLGKAISQMGIKASDLDCYKVQTPPKPIGYLEHEESMTRIPVFKRIGWFHRRMLRWCFGVKYTKED